MKHPEEQGARWDDLLALAYGVMRMSPDAFWTMTPREFDAAARPYMPTAGGSTGRNELAVLMHAFPDID